jgi:hypothetical protein
MQNKQAPRGSHPKVPYDYGADDADGVFERLFPDSGNAGGALSLARQPSAHSGPRPGRSPRQGGE